MRHDDTGEGVAQRVIADHEPFARNNPNIQQRIAGMNVLLDFLSAEARRVLAETWSKPDNGDPHTQMAEWVSQKDLAERLGLDLGSEG